MLTRLQRHGTVLEIIKQALQLFRVVAVGADSAIVETQLLSTAELTWAPEIGPG
jgi:hypothetical protein